MKDPRYPLDWRLVEPVWTLWRNDDIDDNDVDDKEEQHSPFHTELVTQFYSLWHMT
jgi:hypothetical protein